MNVKDLFEQWARQPRDLTTKQWLLSKWENVEGVPWPAEKVEAMIEAIRTHLDLRPTDTFMDLGCGGGWILDTLQPHARRGMGLDFSLAMLEHARTVLKGAGDLVCGEIGRLPLKDESFDRVLCYFVFVNMPDDASVERAFADIQRILKKGGRALVGQLPDKDGSSAYDQAKEEYQSYCRETYSVGEDTRDICRIPQKLYDRDHVSRMLRAQKINFEFVPSFNPFYRPHVERTVPWRFDVILKK